MNQATRSRLDREEGFTLIELLVVILIIGILAAIAIPSFLNQREKGQDACAKSQARTMATAMETFYTETNSYSATIGDLHAIESAVTNNAACGTGTYTYVGYSAPLTAGANAGSCNGAELSGSASSFCVVQDSASGSWFSLYRPANGANRLICGPIPRQGKGSCSSSGTW